MVNELHKVEEEADEVRHEVEDTIKHRLHEPTEQTGREPFGLRLVALILVALISTAILVYLIFFSAASANEIDDIHSTPSVVPDSPAATGDAMDETSFVPPDLRLPDRLPMPLLHDTASIAGILRPNS